MRAPKARRGGTPAGSRSEHDTSKYVAPKARAGSNPSVRIKSQASKKGRMSPRKHR